MNWKERYRNQPITDLSQLIPGKTKLKVIGGDGWLEHNKGNIYTVHSVVGFNNYYSVGIHRQGISYGKPEHFVIVG